MNIKNGILNVPKNGNKHDLIHFVTVTTVFVVPELEGDSKNRGWRGCLDKNRLKRARNIVHSVLS